MTSTRRNYKVSLRKLISALCHCINLHRCAVHNDQQLLFSFSLPAINKRRNLAFHVLAWAATPVTTHTKHTSQTATNTPHTSSTNAPLSCFYVFLQQGLSPLSSEISKVSWTNVFYMMFLQPIYQPVSCIYVLCDIRCWQPVEKIATGTAFIHRITCH